MANVKYTWWFHILTIAMKKFPFLWLRSNIHKKSFDASWTNRSKKYTMWHTHTNAPHTNPKENYESERKQWIFCLYTDWIRSKFVVCKVFFGLLFDCSFSLFISLNNRHDSFVQHVCLCLFIFIISYFLCVIWLVQAMNSCMTAAGFWIPFVPLSSSVFSVIFSLLDTKKTHHW